MDLSTQYLGMKLKSPLVVSSSPLSRQVSDIRRLEDAGAAAVVLHSLFEEQIELEDRQQEHYLSYYTETNPEALTYFPESGRYAVGPEEYLELIRGAKEAVAIPIVASLNGATNGGWIRYARLMADAGADALELNVYSLATDAACSGTQVEQLYLDVLRAVRESVRIPVAVKMSPYFSATAAMAARLADAGANALVLFNRFYQPDLDIARLEVTPRLTLSTSEDLLLPLRWVAILYGRVPADISLTGGVHTCEDVLKAVMAGANITQMASELLQNGVERLHAMETELTRWMEARGYESVAQMRGSLSQKNVADPAAFERANYARTLDSWRPDPTAILP